MYFDVLSCKLKKEKVTDGGNSVRRLSHRGGHIDVCTKNINQELLMLSRFLYGISKGAECHNRREQFR